MDLVNLCTCKFVNAKKITVQRGALRCRLQLEIVTGFSIRVLWLKFLIILTQDRRRYQYIKVYLIKVYIVYSLFLMVFVVQVKHNFPTCNTFYEYVFRNCSILFLKCVFEENIYYCLHHTIVNMFKDYRK